MSRTRSIALLALTAAGLYAVTGAIGIAHDQPTAFADPIDYVLEWAFVGALAATVLALAILGRSGAGLGALIAAIGHVLVLVPATATAVDGREALDTLFVAGFLTIVVGYLILAVGDARRRLSPAGIGLILLLGWCATVAVDATTGAGGFVLAASWAGVARVAGPSEVARAGSARDLSGTVG